MTLRPQKVNFLEDWEILEKNSKLILRLEPVDKKTWTYLFSLVYKITTAFPEPLGDKLQQETGNLLDKHTQSVCNDLISKSNDELLPAYNEEWSIFRQGNEYLNCLFQYLNIQHIKRSKFSESDLTYSSIEPNDPLLGVGELGLTLWRRNVVDPLKQRLVTILLDVIEGDRLQSHTVNEMTVNGVIMSFVHVEEHKKKNPLDLYETVFEVPFLQRTGVFYQFQSEYLAHNHGISDYMEKVLDRLRAEDARSRRFLHPSSAPKVQEVCKAKMVKDQLAWFHDQSQEMVVNERLSDLNNMYQLLRNADDALERLIAILQAHIEKTGKDALAASQGISPGDASAFVEAILRVYRKFLAMIHEVFQSDPQFVSCLDKASSAIINSRTPSGGPCRSPELLAKYCDSLLKRSSQEVDLEERLTSSIVIFKYLDDKDIFQKVYATKLAKRLILFSGMSMAAEEMMIGKLKQACGYEFTSKLHRMFTDIKLSTDLNGQFMESCRNSGDAAADLGGIGFSVYVLQAGAWPFGQANLSSFSLPAPFQKSLTTFEAFYSRKFSGRKLTWLHQQCTCDLKVTPSEADLRSAYMINMGVFPAAILLAFQDTDCLAYKDIQQLTSLNDDQLTRNLNCLIENKLIAAAVVVSPSETSTSSTATSSDSQPGAIPTATAATMSTTTATIEPMEMETSSLTGVLPKASTSAPAASSSVITFSQDTLFTFNRSYRNKKVRVKINIVHPREAPTPERGAEEAAQSTILEDRKLFIQAAIVRLMKLHKTLTHNDLIAKVCKHSQNRFKPSVSIIKKCIEALIDKQYLERGPEGSDSYNYIA